MSGRTYLVEDERGNSLGGSCGAGFGRVALLEDFAGDQVLSKRERTL